MGLTSIGWEPPATQRDRMEAVWRKASRLLRVVLKRMQNDPSQEEKFVLGKKADIAAAHQGIAALHQATGFGAQAAVGIPALLHRINTK